MTRQDELFIVDNTDEHWKALEYVRQWCDISSAVDIATGHFEIGALLALDGEWQKVGKVRILIGGETSAQTVAAVSAALDESFAVERASQDPFLPGMQAIVDAIRDGKIEIRVYRRKKFHAKAYITHSRLDVVGSAALVGSSNFTRPGLTQNVELNVRFNGAEVRELQEWYERHWEDAEPISEELLEVMEKNTREFAPYEIYAKALQALTQGIDPSDNWWEENESNIYGLLAPYQRDAYHGLRRMAEQWRGGFLTDGVGLGKTFVGLMLAEYYASREKLNVLIMAPKTGKEAVWEPEFRARLPELAGSEFSNVVIRSHTDLSTQDAPQIVDRLKDRVDVVIIDEAHNFRNHGKAPEEDSDRKSRWWRMQEICEGKIVFLLTATPINNTLFDLVHEAELFTGMADDYFSSLGVSSIKGYMRKLEKPVLDQIQSGAAAASIDMTDFVQLMRDDKLLESIIWQNSRAYAIESDKKAGGGDVLFPELSDPRVVPYDLALHQSQLLDEVEKAFQKKSPLFTLPMYYPLAFSNEPDVDTVTENRQKQVVGLIKTTFLKRFESSIAAFAGSCVDLSLKIQRWLDLNTRDNKAHAQNLKDWHAKHDANLQKVHDRFRSGQALSDSEHPDDLTAEELEEMEDSLDPKVYDLDQMVEAAFDDLDQLSIFIDQILSLKDVGDDKYRRLHELLTGKTAKGDAPLSPEVATPEFRSQKVLIFTEFADTARYLHDQLVADGVADVDRLDGSRKSDRVNMIRRFAPFYNRVDSAEQKQLAPLRVLVSTDVLSEGVNLQDGTLIINYDIHWNPVRLMQRIGRVDRRMDKIIEAALVKANPKLKGSRGKIQIRNFLAPEDLNRLLRLNQRVQGRAILISKTLGIPGGRLLTEDDILDDVKVMQAFREDYLGTESTLEKLRLEYQGMVRTDPTLPEKLEAVPKGAHSAKDGSPAGVVVCRRRPVPVMHTNEDGTTRSEWTLEGGDVMWAMISPNEDVDTTLDTLAGAIRSDPATQKTPVPSPSESSRLLRLLEKKDRNEYVKRVQLPLTAPQPETICWMVVR